MIGFITCFLVGCLCIVFGLINMTGNLSTLHEYHRRRVSEQDRKPFGRQIGLGTVLVGVSVLSYGACLLIYDKTQSNVVIWIGVGVLIVGTVVGAIVSFRAMTKYNKGIF